MASLLASPFSSIFVLDLFEQHIQFVIELEQGVVIGNIGRGRCGPEDPSSVGDVAAVISLLKRNLPAGAGSAMGSWRFGAEAHLVGKWKWPPKAAVVVRGSGWVSRRWRTRVAHRGDVPAPSRPDDPIAAPVSILLRKPLPAQALTISGLANALQTSRSVRIVGECGTGKTLMSMGVAHTHANGAPYSAIAMCPPHLVLKWAREVFITVPRARAFVIYDLRNGGDPSRPHGVAEVQMKQGHAVNEGLKSSLFEMRAMGRKGWRTLCPGPAYFIVSRETGKLRYHWKHTYNVAEYGRDKGAVVNPYTGTTIPSQDGGRLTRLDFAALKHSEIVFHSNDGTELFLGTLAGGPRRPA
jgi:hypothetical protein